MIEYRAVSPVLYMTFLQRLYEGHNFAKIHYSIAPIYA